MMAADVGGEHTTGSSTSSISNLLGLPIQLVQRLLPGYSHNEANNDDQSSVEMVSDKLRKKRNKAKHRSSPLKKSTYSSHSHDTGRRKHVGSHRSVVRYIGSNVPITPSKGACFEYFDHSRKALMSHASTVWQANLDQFRQHVDHVKYNVVPSLADLGQLVWDDNFEDEEEILSEDEELQENTDDGEKNEPSTSSTDLVENSSSGVDGTKITALEDELAKLRAQIAMIVSNQTTPMVPVAVVHPSSVDQPTTASLSVAPAPPPPPPPPLPPMLKSASDAKPIKIVKKKSTEELFNTPAQTNMDDVLKGISNVKLRTSDMKRSPGGTPLKRHTIQTNSTNPADIIANALREKFRNSKMCYDSPEKEYSPQSGFSPSPTKGKNRKSMSPKVHSRTVRPVPKPRPRPRPRTQKRTKTEKRIEEESTAETETQNVSFS